MSPFQVDVDIPAYLSVNNGILSGIVYANYTSGAPVSGNVSVKASVRPLAPHRPHLHYAPEPALLMPATPVRYIYPLVDTHNAFLFNYYYYLVTFDGIRYVLLTILNICSI